MDHFSQNPHCIIIAHIFKIYIINLLTIKTRISPKFCKVIKFDGSFSGREGPKDLERYDLDPKIYFTYLQQHISRFYPSIQIHCTTVKEKNRRGEITFLCNGKILTIFLKYYFKLQNREHIL